MRKTRVVRAAILLLPASFALAASCVGESESETETDDPLLLDEVPTAEAPAALDGGCTTDSGADGGGTGGTGGGSSLQWPACGLDDLWVLCGVEPVSGFDLVYGPVDEGSCAKTGPVANSSTYCRPKVVIDPSKPGCGDVCAIFRHEICHVRQTKTLCTKCQQAHPGGGLAFNHCIEDSTFNCRRTQEAQCHDEGCNSGDAHQCAQQAFFCDLLKQSPPSGGGIACDQFTAGSSSCACANMGTAHCGSGTCSSGKSCVLSGSACACVSPPPPQDGGTDASSDAPEGG